MTVTWIASRTQETAEFNPAGLGRPSTVGPVGMELLTRGSLLMEATVRPRSHPVNLLRFGALDPWPSGLTVCLEPDGTMRLMIRQGGRHLETALKTTLGAKVQTIHVTYVWDAPARTGHFSVHIPDHGVLWQTEVLMPFPLSLRDARRIVQDNKTCLMNADVAFVAIGDAPCPLGPMPGLTGHAAVDTPNGQVALRDISPGDLVNIYMRLWDDLIAGRDQRICLEGSEVEYLFGEERVTTAIRHLEVRNCAVPTRPAPAVITYYQILLKTHEIITVNGALVESFDGSAVLNTTGRLATSVLAGMDAKHRPRSVGLAAPVLQGYEALTLTGVSIG